MSAAPDGVAVGDELPPLEIPMSATLPSMHLKRAHASSPTD